MTLPRNRELVGEVHAIKRRVLPSGTVSLDAERNAPGATPTSSGRWPLHRAPAAGWGRWLAPANDE